MPSAILEKRGTPIVFTNTGGDRVLNLRNLANGSGRLSAFYDRGTGAAPSEYELRAYMAFGATPTAGRAVYVAVCESNGTHTDGGFTFSETSDAALTQAEFNGLRLAGVVPVHTADDNEKGMTFRTRISSRYFAIAVYNDSNAALADVDAASGVIATPLYPEVQ